MTGRSSSARAPNGTSSVASNTPSSTAQSMASRPSRVWIDALARSSPSAGRGRDVHGPVPGFVGIGREPADRAVHPVDHRAVRVVVEREHAALLAVRLFARQRVHRSGVDAAVRQDRIPSLPHRRRAAIDLVEPGRRVPAQQHQVGLVEVAVARQREQHERRAEEPGRDAAVLAPDVFGEARGDGRAALGRGEIELERERRPGLRGDRVVAPLSRTSPRRLRSRARRSRPRAPGRRRAARRGPEAAPTGRRRRSPRSRSRPSPPTAGRPAHPGRASRRTGTARSAARHRRPRAGAGARPTGACCRAAAPGSRPSRTTRRRPAARWSRHPPSRRAPCSRSAPRPSACRRAG